MIETSEASRSHASIDSDRSAGRTTPRGTNSRTVAIAALVGLQLAAVVGVLVLAPPSWLVRDFVQRIVAGRTGKVLVVDGATHLSLRPQIRLLLEKVSLVGPPGDTAPPTLTANKVEVVVAIRDIWQLEFDVSEIVLDAPAIDLRLGDPLVTGLAEGRVAFGGLPKKISLQHGTIALGTGTPPQTSFYAEDVSGVFIRTADGKGLEFAGALRAMGEHMRVDAAVDDVVRIASGTSSPVRLSVASALGDARVAGDVATRPIWQIVGDVSVRTGELEKMLRWAEVDTGQIDLGRKASIEAKIAGTARRLSIGSAQLKFDALSGKAEGDIAFDGMRPTFKGSLSEARIDIDTLLPKAIGPAAFAIEPLESRLAIPSAWDSLLQEIASGPVHRPWRDRFEAAIESSSALSTEPFKLTALPAIDVDMTIAAEELRYGRIPIKNARLQVTSGPQRLEIEVNDAEIHQGRVGGRVDVGVGEGPLQAAVQLTLSRVSLEPLVADVLRQRLLAGKGDLDLNVSGRGGCMREFVGSLDGTARMQVESGAIIGFDVRRAVLALGSGQTYNTANRTRFDTLKAGVTVRKGIVRTTDPLSMLGPEVDITSRGALGLVSRRIDQAVRLSLKPPPMHLPIKLNLRGTLDEPKFSWDIFSAIADPARLATPFAVGAKEERMPAAVREAITRALAAEPSTLSPQARVFLGDLLRTR